MGDRANIKLVNGESKVYFYAHWMGTDLFKSAQKAIAKRQRWDDYPYLNAIVFRQVLADADPKLEGTTGIGIDAEIGDNEYKILTLDVEKQTVCFETEDGDAVAGSISFEQFADGHFPEGQEI